MIVVINIFILGSIEKVFLKFLKMRVIIILSPLFTFVNKNKLY